LLRKRPEHGLILLTEKPITYCFWKEPTRRLLREGKLRWSHGVRGSGRYSGGEKKKNRFRVCLPCAGGGRRVGQLFTKGKGIETFLRGIAKENPRPPTNDEGELNLFRELDPCIEEKPGLGGRHRQRKGGEAKLPKNCYNSGEEFSRAKGKNFPPVFE